MPVITTLGVPGMTCGHCVSAVTNELKEVPGVQRVSVELRKDAVSEVTLLSHGPLDEAALRAAVDEAGYEVQSITVAANGLAEQSQEQRDQRAEFYGNTPA
jgi:copper chaperone